jgi:hypothetical protein
VTRLQLLQTRKEQEEQLHEQLSSACSLDVTRLSLLKAVALCQSKAEFLEGCGWKAEECPELVATESVALRLMVLDVPEVLDLLDLPEVHVEPACTK